MGAHQEINGVDLAGPTQDTHAQLWTAILVFAVGVLATVASWHAIRIHEHSEVRWVTKLAAQSIRTDLVTDMEWQMVGLDRLAMLWEAADPAQELWTRNAELYIQHRKGCVAVEWLTPDRHPRVVIWEAGPKTHKPLAYDGLPTTLIEAARKSTVAVIGPPAVLPDGSRQWTIAYPVYARGEARGFIVAFFDFKESLDSILADVQALGFSFAVLPPNQPEYLLPGSSREHELEWGEVLDVPLSGTTWQLRVWPKSDVVNAIKSSLPDVTLAAGVALSLLLALTLYFATGEARSSARTRQANQALQREISMREGAQEELRRAHAELEKRIDQRTVELASANTLLQKEVTEHQHSEESLRALTGRLFQLQDEERRRLARELHDGAVQNLVALAMDIGMIREAVAEEDSTTRTLVNQSLQLIKESTSELRTISYLLHPPYFDELGLTAALRDFVDGFSTRSGIEVTLYIDRNLGRVGHDVELTVYRVVQEALSNVYRHAQSRTAAVSIARNAEFVHLEIRDNGRGIPPEVLAPASGGLSGVGIAGMRERVRLIRGRLDIESGKGGTTIQAVIPVTDVSLREPVGCTTYTSAN